MQTSKVHVDGSQELMSRHPPHPSNPLLSLVYISLSVFLAWGLYLLSRENYLLFHSLVEFSGIGLSLTIFSIGWNSRDFARNETFLLLAAAYLPIGVIDLLHVLTYKGMGVFTDITPNFSTQLWIAARYMESAAYLSSALVIGRFRHLPAPLIFFIAAVAGTVLIASVWPLEIFPTCFVEGTGLTPLKVLSEYIICLVLLVALYCFYQKRRYFDERIFDLLIWSVVATIFSELSFTLYNNVYGFANFLGHCFKVVSVIFLYRAFVLGTLRTPYQSLFRDLIISRTALENELDHRRRAEEDLRGANRELDAFVHTVSHDLRSPLTPIIGFAGLLKDKLKKSADGETLDALLSIEEQGKRMLSLLEDLLTLSRLGHIDKTPKNVEGGQVLQRVLEEMGPAFAVEGVKLTVGDLPSLVTHPNLLYQIFVNIVGNAIRYAGVKGNPLEIEGKREEKKVSFSFCDHGRGIPPDERERIFDLFYRGAGGEKAGGTGLGLAIVQKIVRMHNGRVWVEETPGGGSTFRIEMEDLPVSEGAEAENP